MAGATPGSRPGHGGPSTRAQRRPWLPPGHQDDLLGVITPTLENGGHGCLRAEQALHPGQRPGGPGGRTGVVTPKTELAAIVRAHFFRDKGEAGDPARLRRLHRLPLHRRRGSHRPGIPGRRHPGLAGLCPTFQLPAHSFADGSRAESTVMAPTTAQRSPVLGLCFDGQARADQARSHETGMELFGQCPPHEHGGVQLVRRRVEVRRHHPVRGRQAAL